MTLARTALRLATVAALQGADANSGQTIANNRVYDSRITDFSPETYPDDAKPTVIVLTDEDDGEELSHQNGGPPFRRMIKLVFEFAMVQGFDVPVEDGGTQFVPGYPATDAEHEASLDFLEFQIMQRLAIGLDQMPILWRQFARVRKYDCHRQLLDESGVKIAARVLTLDCEVNDDETQIFNTADAIPTGFDAFPDPLKTIAKALTPGSTAFNTATALANAMVPVTAGPLDGVDFTFAEQAEQDPSDMLDVSVEIRNAVDTPQIVIAAGTGVIDYSKGTFQNIILASDCTSLSVINWPTNAKTGRLILKVTNTGSFSIAPHAWPSGTEWVDGGDAPTITAGAGSIDLIVLVSGSGGVEIFGNVAGQNYKPSP